MRALSLRISISCVIAFTSFANAQSPARSCTLAHPNPQLNPAQQKLASDGYRLACESANALTMKQKQEAAQESQSGAELDEYIPDTPVPVFNVVASAPLSAYKKWIANTCPNLNRQVLLKVQGLPDSDQLVVVQYVYWSVRESRKCQ